jgi:hypothetical protein
VNSKHSTAVITYIVLIPAERPEDVSPFQGFSFNTFGLPSLLRAMVEWPSGLYDCLLDRQKLLFSRLRGTGPLQIEILQVNVLTEAALQQFTVLISTDAVAEETQRFVDACPYPLLHLTTGRHTRIPHYSTVTPEVLYEHCRRVIAFVTAKGGAILTPALPERPPARTRQPVPFKAYGHNVTLPNELAIRSLGLVPEEAPCPILQLTRHPDTSADVVNAPYKRIILETAESVRTLRREISGRGDLFGAVDVILTAPSVYSELPTRQWAAGAERLGCDQSTFRTVLDQLLKQRNYPQLMLDGTESGAVLSSTAARLVTSMRKWELDLYTAIVGVRAAGYFCPVVRVPPAVNLLRGRLVDLVNSVRGPSTRKRDKLSMLARRMGLELASLVGLDLMGFIERTEVNVKIIADAPLEFLPIEGLPLAARYSTSRITTTPGNLFATQGLTSRVTLLEPAELQKVLVVRSFKDDDPRRFHLEKLTRRYLGRFTDSSLVVDWVDVHDADGLVTALKNFDGHIVVYDGHGSFSSDAGNGALQIGGSDLDVWSLRYRVRAPPIIILSACDTHALDGTHASTANGFLMLGATTVLATLAPVDSLHSAALVGRLMLRLDAYLEELPRRDVLPLRWSEIMGGLLRMNYLTDMLAVLRRRGVVLTTDQWLVVTRTATDWINALDSRWPEKTFDLLARLTGENAERIATMAKKYAYFSETLKYVQLGNPEEIVIVDPSWRRKAEALR